MKLVKEINKKEILLLGVFFVAFVLSYTINIFRISEADLFHGFERQPEGLVVGRLVRSAHDGIFSYGGLTGINYNSKSERTTEQYAADLAAQHNLYLTNENVPDSYQAYKSQSGGQGIFFSALQKISPLSNAQNLMLFRGLNALLIAFVFCFFGWWVLKSFGLATALVTLLLTLFSPWINVFSHNLWWVLWSFYLPFITMTIALSYRYKYPEKLSEVKILVLLFSSVFLKCFFTGFEFITTTLAAAVCPIVFYCYLEKKSLGQFIVFSLKASVAMILGVLTQMLVLITQIKYLEGSFSDGVNHIVHSFTKRTVAEVVSLSDVIVMYFQGDVFPLGFLSNNTNFYFGVLVLIVVSVSAFLFLRGKERKMQALSITCLFSILAPLTWFVVFKQHSYEHPHMDYIVWYMPFLLYGFVSIGELLSFFLRKKREYPL